MIASHFPALQVIVPLLAASLCVLLRRGTAAWLLALAASWSCAVIAAALWLRVLESGPISYMLGSWAAPWGIEYRIDAVNAFVLLLVSTIGGMALFGLNGFVIGPVIAAMFMAAWDIFARARQDELIEPPSV